PACISLGPSLAPLAAAPAKLLVSVPHATPCQGRASCALLTGGPGARLLVGELGGVSRTDQEARDA
ncbi:MAG: hypothetical protein ACXV2B_08655, partial [Halobacteriota archaeon]